MFAHSFKISDLCKIIDQPKCKGINSVLNLAVHTEFMYWVWKTFPDMGEKIKSLWLLISRDLLAVKTKSYVSFNGNYHLMPSVLNTVVMPYMHPYPLFL